ncbi:MAG: hypothetical protein F6K21_25745, partial [Symploca sp. SIO2D2]|nr:hypothetical protein [Symploca sp. SIO2D2]
IAAPLMIAQLGLGAISVILAPSYFSAIIFGLVIATWMNTFIQLVPLHRDLQAQGKDEELINQLLSKNRIRLLIWITILAIKLSQDSSWNIL